MDDKNNFELSESYEQIANHVADYICSLPNGSKVTLKKAVKAACPDIFENLNFLDYRLLSLVEDKVNGTDTIMDLSDHDDKCEGLPYSMDFYVWHKRLQNIRIISDLLCYGLAPEPDEPEEQHLTISFTGKVWFSEYLFGELGENVKTLGRKMQCNIGKERAARILSYFADYFESKPFPVFATDVGSWYMTATWANGSKQKLSGSMIGDVLIGKVDLTRLIREEIPIENLSAFSLKEDT